MNYNICILPGDGIGKEITQWAEEAIRIVGEYKGIDFQFSRGLIGHEAIEQKGNPLPGETIDLCKSSAAVLLGAVGHPKYDNDPTLKVRPEQGLLKIRKELGLYANIRPVRIFDVMLNASSLKPEVIRGADIVFFRELTGGIYFGERGRIAESDAAFDTLFYSKYEVERIVHKAFQTAKKRKKILHSIDKANVLESSRLWRETVQKISISYPEVEVVHMFVDNAAMQLIRDPRQFDVVVTGNMFGDILTDEASQISASLGLLPSASMGDEIGLFEPIHGSAHDIAGRNMANPIASILSAVLLLEMTYGWMEEAGELMAAVDSVLKEGFRTRDIASEGDEDQLILGTAEMGKKITKELKQRLEVMPVA